METLSNKVIPVFNKPKAKYLGRPELERMRSSFKSCGLTLRPKLEPSSNRSLTFELDELDVESTELTDLELSNIRYDMVPKTVTTGLFIGPRQAFNCSYSL